MKSIRIAYIIFTLLLVATIINSIILGRIIEGFSQDISKAEEIDMATAEKEYSEIYERYKSIELYISLSINHDDLSNLENAFAEIIGAAKAGDREAVITIKSRMNDYLRHIRRLTGINIDSVF
ncbi:MAG: DUF4363 family protein [Clostridia bacterium]|nr:DUF4363 family protein [Clostridia bacterium]